MNSQDRRDRAAYLARKAACMDAAATFDKGRGKLGSKQNRLLACLFDHGHYSPGCGWVWGSDSETQHVLSSLVNRGLVNVEWQTIRPGHYGGRAAYYRPRYTLCDDLARIAYPNDTRWGTKESTTDTLEGVAAQ